MDLAIILKNLAGYDAIIILVAIFNGYLLYQLKKDSEQLKEVLNPTVFLPIEQLIKQTRDVNKTIDLHHIRQLKEKENKTFHLYAAITSLFPLLGILGTILSLIKIVGLGDTSLMLNFSEALTSTFWGLIFGITFKAFGGILSGRSESNNEMLQLLFQRIDDFLIKSGDKHE